MSIEVHVRVRPGVTNSAWTAADTVICSTARQDHRFPFGRVYNTSSTNNSVFSSVDPLIHAAFDGKNVTIMAYGQTGSGKTHSMVGTPTDAGIMRRTAEVLSNLRAAYPGTTVDASCIEIYNETVSDLLLEPRERKPIEIRGDGVNTTYEKTLVPIASLQDFVTLHASAERYRRYGVTDLNGHSSRSHIMLAFHIKRPNRSEGSVINLVDLAGSESAGKANTTGDTLREGGFINRSLLALGNVVSDIVAKKSHVAFRGSNLTRLLSPCLSGDGLTFILCCINPGAENYDQTVNALQFSQRAMKIKKDPTVTLTNMVPLFAFPLHRQLQQRQSRVTEMLASSYQSGIYETYMNVQDTVLSAIFDKENKAIADAQAEAFNLQAQLIAKDHLSSVNHLKRQREILEGHKARKLAALSQLEEKSRGDRDMATRVEEMRSKKHRVESDYAALLEDSKEAKAQWMSALEEAVLHDRDTAFSAFFAEEARQRLSIEAKRPLFLEQIAEAMMATIFNEREQVLRALGGIAAVTPPTTALSRSLSPSSGDLLHSPTNADAIAFSSSRAETIAAKLEIYKTQLLQQRAELNAAAAAIREMEGDFASGEEINPSLLRLTESEALEKIHALEELVSELQHQLLSAASSCSAAVKSQSRADTPPPLPTARHKAVMFSKSSPTHGTSNSSSASGVPHAANMARLKSAVNAIADAKERMGGTSSMMSRSKDVTLIHSPPTEHGSSLHFSRRASVVAPTSRPPPSATSKGSAVSSNLRPPNSSASASVFGTVHSPNVFAR